MAISKREILRKIKAVLSAFFQADGSLLNVNASERSISHKFAEHLQKQFPDLVVDCEYNRHGNDIKMLRYYHSGLTKVANLEARTVFPDIVVHKRGNDKDNLLIIEIKKSDSGQNYRPDLEKLKAFTGDQFRYKVGIFLLFDVERKCLCCARCFSAGKEVNPISRSSLKEFMCSE